MDVTKHIVIILMLIMNHLTLCTITLGHRLNFIKEYGLKKYVDNVNHGIRNSVYDF